MRREPCLAPGGAPIENSSARERHSGGRLTPWIRAIMTWRPGQQKVKTDENALKQSMLEVYHNSV